MYNLDMYAISASTKLSLEVTGVWSAGRGCRWKRPVRFGYKETTWTKMDKGYIWKYTDTILKAVIQYGKVRGRAEGCGRAGQEILERSLGMARWSGPWRQYGGIWSYAKAEGNHRGEQVAWKEEPQAGTPGNSCAERMTKKKGGD